MYAAKKKGKSSLRGLRRRYARGARSPAHDEARAAARDRERRAVPRVPTDRPDRHAGDRRRRGARQVASPGARHRPADGVHPVRGGERPDQRHRPLGPSSCGQGRGQVAGRVPEAAAAQDVGERFGISLHGARIHRRTDRRPKRGSPRPGHVGPRDHRERAARLQGRGRTAGRGEEARGPSRHRRLRHRLLVPRIHPQLPDRPSEDRQVVHRLRSQRCGRFGPRPSDREARRLSGPTRRRRRRRGPGPGRRTLRYGVRAGAGLTSTRDRCRRLRSTSSSTFTGRCCITREPPSSQATSAADRPRAAWGIMGA